MGWAIPKIKQFEAWPKNCVEESHLSSCGESTLLVRKRKLIDKKCFILFLTFLRSVLKLKHGKLIQNLWLSSLKISIPMNLPCRFRNCFEKGKAKIKWKSLKSIDIVCKSWHETSKGELWRQESWYIRN
jgi:hypothetical protein